MRWGAGGYNRSNWYYLASCDVTLPGPSGPVTTKMRRVFEKKLSNPFNYFMFFNDDLELQPSTTLPLTIYGAVHTNGKFYAGTGPSALTVNSTVPSLYGFISSYILGSPSGITPTGGITYADDWVTGFKSGDTFHTGGAAAPTIVSSIPPSRGPNLQVYDWDPTAWNASDADTTNDSPHEITELPPASGTDFMAKSIWAQGFPTDFTSYSKTVQRSSRNATIRINIAANDLVTIYSKDASGNEVALNATMTGPGTDPTIYDSYYAYQFAYKQWIAALGVNTSGQFSAAKNATNGKTTNASTTLTFAAAAGMNLATPGDLGRIITGAGIPAGTTITAIPATTIAAASNGLTLPRATITVASTASWSTSTGQLFVTTSSGVQTVTFTGKTATTFTGCTLGAGTMSTGGAVSSGTEATLSKQATATASNVSITIGSGALTTAAIQDNREGAMIDIVDIDCDMFKNWRPQTAYPLSDTRRSPMTFESVLSGFGVYIHADPRTATSRKRAIRFKNAGVLTQVMSDPGALSTSPTNPVPISIFVTDNPVYIWGDFNTGRTTTSQGSPPNNAGTVPACNNDATKLNYVYDDTGGGNPGWSGSITSITADAVTLLSNAWLDSNSTLTLTSRIASNTTVNANIVAGNVPTSLTNGYSGGGENFIRLLEDWSNGKRFSFTGSMVQLYQSKTANGKWVPPGTAGNVYNEPTRNWYWLSGDFIAGGTDLYTISYRKHKWSPNP